MQQHTKAMIDLKELERRLDEALEKETSESLTAWLFDQRKGDSSRFLGAGSILPCGVDTYSFNVSPQESVEYNYSNQNSPSEQLEQAA